MPTPEYPLHAACFPIYFSYSRHLLRLPLLCSLLWLGLQPFALSTPLPPLPSAKYWVHTLPPIPPLTLTLMSPSVAPRLLTVEFSISVIYLGIPIALSHLFASTPLGPYAPLVPLLGEAPPGLIGLNSPWLKPILNSDYTELS